MPPAALLLPSMLETQTVTPSHQACSYNFSFPQGRLHCFWSFLGWSIYFLIPWSIHCRIEPQPQKISRNILKCLALGCSVACFFSLWGVIYAETMSRMDTPRRGESNCSIAVRFCVIKKYVVSYFKRSLHCPNIYHYIIVLLASATLYFRR